MKLKQIGPKIVVGMLATSILSIGVATPVQAATWHKGTPKIARGTWYHNGGKANSTYMGYTNSTVAGNALVYVAKKHAFYRLPAHGYYDVKYKALGHHRYYLVGTDMFQKRNHETITVTKKHLSGNLYGHFQKFTRRAPGKILKGDGL